ncbi:hypothetical protein [Xanthomonas phage XacN1]|nr:hypothetical protein [Xanthomonas phage XacN1]
MADYNVRHTDRSVSPITVPETEVNDTALDVVLFGRINPEYGEKLDEDLLNLLENFACPEASTTTDFNDATPDLTQTSKTQLHNPTIGQLWFNSTRDTVYYWRGDVWWPIPLREYVAANWGSIMDGQQLPKPVSPITGHVFDYQDCIWSVAPAAYIGKLGAASCATDANAVVTMKYRISGTNTAISGLANYLIIGIRGNFNSGQSIPPIEFTVTPTPTMTMTPEASVTPTPTPTRAATPTITPTRTRTPVGSPQPTISPTLTPTPAASSTPAATVTPTPTPGPSSTPAPTPPPVTPPGLGGSYGDGACYARNGTGSISYFVNFATNGQVTEGSSLAVAPPGNAGNWLGSAPNPGDFEIMFTGSPPNSLTAGVWYNLGTGRNYIWTTTASSPSTPATRMISGTFQMRRASTGVVFSTASVGTVQLSLNNECL